MFLRLSTKILITEIKSKRKKNLETVEKKKCFTPFTFNTFFMRKTVTAPSNEKDCFMIKIIIFFGFVNTKMTEGKKIS